jgi:hypothetical protein
MASDQKFLVINGKEGNLAAIRKIQPKLANAIESVFSFTLPNEGFKDSLKIVNGALSGKNLEDNTPISFVTRNDDKGEIFRFDTSFEFLKVLESGNYEASKAVRDRSNGNKTEKKEEDALNFF